MKKIVVLALALVVLTGCTDPKRIEQANAIRRESEAAFAATSTAVALDEQERTIGIQATATAIAQKEKERRATEGDRIKRKKATQKAAVIFGAAYVSIIFLATAIALLGNATAEAKRANLQARLVHLDPETRCFPVMVDGPWLVDLETGERALLTSVSQPHAGKLAISGQTRTTGLLAQAAEKIAKAAKSPQPGDMIPAIGGNVPMLNWLPELKEREGLDKGAKSLERGAASQDPLADSTTDSRG
jgi:hypothetical protein